MLGVATDAEGLAGQAGVSIAGVLLGGSGFVLEVRGLPAATTV